MIGVLVVVGYLTLGVVTTTLLVRWMPDEFGYDDDDAFVMGMAVVVWPVVVFMGAAVFLAVRIVRPLVCWLAGLGKERNE